MSPLISRSDLQTLLHEANVAARRLIRQWQLPYQELADLRQELLLDLLTRLAAFDLGRGSLGAFAGTVMANRATRISHRVKRERRLYGAVPVSLDESMPDGTTPGDLVAEDQGLAAYLGQPTDAFVRVERRLDLERALGALQAGDGRLCAALCHATADRLAANGHGTRSSLYRRVRRIRLELMAAGLQAAA